MGRSGEIWPLGDWVPPDPGSTFRINRQGEDRSEVRRKEGGRERRKRGRADFERRKFLGWKGFLRFSRDSAATKQKWKRNEREREKGFLNRAQRRGFWSRWKISNRSSRSSWGEWRSSARLPCILWLGHGGEDHPFDIYIFTCIYIWIHADIEAYSIRGCCAGYGEGTRRIWLTKATTWHHEEILHDDSK